MTALEHPATKNFICPVCKTTEDAPVIFIPNPTSESVKNDFTQVHARCIANAYFVIMGEDLEIENYNNHTGMYIEEL